MANTFASRCILVALVMVATTSITAIRAESEAEEKEVETRSDGGCIINGRYYSNGRTFTMPGSSHCLTYVCHRGGYSVSREACEVEDQCYDVGRVFDVKCTTYRCEKSQPSHNTFWYQAVAVSHRCEDVYGNCHHPGDKFAYSLSGFLYQDCTCSVSNSQIRYSCIGRTSNWP